MHTAHTVTDIRAAAPYDARRMIGENMAAAILTGCNAVVEVTLGRPGHYIVSGDAGHVRAAAAVLEAAGMRLLEIEDDAELGETFATWTAK